LDYYAPISSDVLDELLPCLDLNEKALIVDIGCGAARLMIDIVKRTGCRAIGVDNDAAALDLALENVNGAGLADKIEFKNSIQDISEEKFGKQLKKTMHCIDSNENNFFLKKK
jgi:cyclopropane fatty-acyl-phospholipid synthase-like methyltransferase